MKSSTNKKYLFITTAIIVIGWFLWWLLRRDYACEVDTTKCSIYDLSTIEDETTRKEYKALNENCEKERTTCNLLILFDAL